MKYVVSLPLIDIHQCPQRGLIGSVQTGGRLCLKLELLKISLKDFEYICPDSWEIVSKI